MDDSTRTIESVLNTFSEFWIGAIYLWIGIALAMFIWGVIKVIKDGDNSEAVGEGKKYILWGLIGLFVIVSMWGLVALLQNTFSLNNADPGERVDDIFPADVVNR